MTPLSKPVTRLSPVTIRDGGKPRQLVVTLKGEFLILRLHGTRKEEVVNLEHAFFGAVKARVFQEKMVKGKLRKEKADRAAATRRFLSSSTRARNKAAKS